MVFGGFGWAFGAFLMGLASCVLPLDFRLFWTYGALELL